MTPAIMSRFDLFYIVLDECNRENDTSVARHIVDMHRCDDVPQISPKYTMEQMRLYIRVARSLKPVIDESCVPLMASLYSQLRMNDTVGPCAPAVTRPSAGAYSRCAAPVAVAGGSKASYRITVRQLESMIRLSEALARLHYSHKVCMRA